ncbi:SDR family NAD(P)-dependent oxidoreductase [Pseudorhodobacter turbinis]|uniref:SDR family NAD(P)-dependent oxidoreductase n=1 Tax=Pseudorhodobacter turbinis TaxID=2500533 RepID=A0A4P8EH46_9RHOB|nr:SDR family NAD(P)-dependent oxidoreductase [Pseudorhodobacter turbinis]QCO56073.1 SDR family NAD(P)-dependent oxidoreductase [Pseudorhodobacter turbinis]
MRETIWIIGASDGIGAALAQEWAGRGARLILSARSADRLGALAASLGPQHIALPLDVADRHSIEAAAAKLAGIGPLDRIVHLAALYDPGNIADADPERAAKIITVNLTGSFHIAQIAPPLLRAGGQLALCGSVAGYIGLPQGQVYSATKAGVINLAETLRAELAGRVDVRLICPGFVDTRMTKTNDFDMPAMVTPEAAARAIIKGLKSRRFEVHFPRRLTYVLKLLRALPYWAALPLMRRLVR